VILLDEDTIQDLSAESMLIGSFFNHCELFEEYLELISATYDFSDPTLRFTYNLLVDTYMHHSVLNEVSINNTVYKMNEEDQALYKKLGGYKIFERLGKVAQTQIDVKKIYEKVKLFNVLRNLDAKGFGIKKHLDKLKDKTVDQVLKAFELQLNKTSSFIKGINDGEILADGMVDFYHQLLKTPDLGVPIYCKTISDAIRGLRLGTVRGIGAATNKGKSRYVCRELMDLAIIKQVPVLLIINETTVAEFRLQMLTCVVNNIIGKKYNIQINESKIAIGDLTDNEKKIVEEAAKYIEDNSKLIVYETYVYDPQTLKMIIRKHQLRDKINYFYIDIYKAFRTLGGQHMSEWQVLAEGSNQMKQMAVELNIHITFTLQIQTSTETTGQLNVDAIQGAKQIANFVDTMVMMRELKEEEKGKYKYILQEEGNPFSGDKCEINPYEHWYAFKLVKNRAGVAGIEVAFRVQRGELIFDEKGILVKYLDK
jgi:replicative DNA helicase